VGQVDVKLTTSCGNVPSSGRRRGRGEERPEEGMGEGTRELALWDMGL
jgi:hypothetical protein